MGRREPLTPVERMRIVDAEMYRKRVERHTVREIGEFFGMHHSRVVRRLAKMPASVKARIRDDVRRLHRLRLADLGDECEALTHA